LSSMVGGNYTLSPKAITPPAEKPPAEKPPAEKPKPTPAPILAVPPLAPVIYSSTHLDPAKWYSNNSPSFSWDLPLDATGVSLKLDEKANSDPGPLSDGLLKSKDFQGAGDGIWYFHIKFKNKYGWGQTTHRKVLIDTGPPKPFEIKIERENETDPRPVLHFETVDETSGIEYYELKIGEGELFPVNTEELKHNPYKMPFQAPGKYAIEVKAFDKAGNSTSAQGELLILPIESPKITKIPKSIKMGDALTIEGEVLPEITVRIFIQRAEKEPIMEKIKADLAGKFVFSYGKPLAKDNYVIWVQSEDERGALSYPTEKYALEVGLPPFLKFGKIAVDYLTTMITLIVLIVGILVIIFYSWYRISLWRKRVRRETVEAEEKLHTAFLALREEVEEQVAKLDGQPGLNQRENEICADLKEALKASEEYVGKEIKDISKELE